MRIVMYVQNDVTRDSRVRREAGSLAAAGHEVTVIGTTTPDGSAPDLETIGGFTIRRVPWRRETAWWVTWVRGPWALIPLGLRSIRRNVARGPRGVSRALAIAGFLVASSPWTVVRAAWYVTVNRGLKRPARFAGLLYVRRWRAEFLAWDRAAVAAAPEADVHHAHDMEALPAARGAAARDRSLYVYDSHEIFMEWGAVTEIPRILRWVFGRWERSMARAAAALVTINDSIAADLRRRLEPRQVVVLHNCPPRFEPPPVPDDRIRRALGLRAETPIVLCHGGFSPNRGLTETADAMTRPGLEVAHLVFLGYRAVFIESILARPDLAGRVHFLPAVGPDEVTAWVAGADVDVMAIQPTDENSRLSTPNKLFESLAAGVPVVSSDFPERRRIIAGDPLGPLGALCDPASPDSIAAALRSILEAPPNERSALRARCLDAAHTRWNWESEVVKLTALYGRLEAAAKKSQP